MTTKANTKYVGYTEHDPAATRDEIKWLWKTLEASPPEQIARFLQFVTGSSRIPLKGFTGDSKLQIRHVSNPDLLPQAHTCFNRLDLPAYDTKEILKEKLMLALKWTPEGFGDE